MNSIRARLLAGIGLVLALVLIGAGSALYGLVRERLVDELDQGLLTKARLLASLPEQEHDTIDLEFEDLDMREFASADQGGFLQVWFAGKEIYRSPSLGSSATLPRASGTTPRFSWTPADGASLRSVGFEFVPRQEHGPPRADAPRLAITLAGDASRVHQTLATLATVLIGVGSVAALIAGLVVVLVVGRSLRPLRRLAEDVAGIGEGDLGVRFETQGLPTEARPLALRLNELLARLQGAFARERDFAAEVAHELRTPLAGLRTSLEVAKRSSDAPDASLTTCLDMVQQLQALVERLLTLARLEAGQAQPARRALDLSELAVESWGACASHAVSRGLQVTWDVEPGLHVDADPQLLGLVLRNLLDNATSYADAGGWIRIEVASADTHARLAVVNSGSRLDAEQAQQAQRRLWRGDDARSGSSLHCGLGLSLVDKAAQALHAPLTISSEQGGEFSVVLLLPLASGAPSTDPALAAQG